MITIKIALKLYSKEVVKKVIYMHKNYGYNFSYKFFNDSKNKDFLNCLTLIF